MAYVDDVDGYRLLVLRAALHLEVIGMRRKGRSAYSMIREEFGLRGNKVKVFEQFDRLVEAKTGVKRRRKE